MPRRYPRLSRKQVIARLRAHAEEHGFVSLRSLHEHDPVAQRSILLHFPGLGAARHAAGVEGPSRLRPLAKRTRAEREAPHKRALWSRERVVAELKRLHRNGQPTALADLVEAGQAALISAANEYVGGLTKARALAGIPKTSARAKGHRRPHTKDSIVAEIRERHRQGKLLSPSRVPQHLYSAARYQFGSWPAAVAAAGVTSDAYRPKLLKYTRAQIIEVLRRAAEAGIDLTRDSLARVIRINAVRREFGTLEAALLAAGLGSQLAQRRHGAKMWDRERLIETLRARAARKEYTLTPGLFEAVALHFGNAEEARRAAGVPSPTDVRMAERRRAKAQIRAAERARRRKRYE